MRLVFMNNISVYNLTYDQRLSKTLGLIKVSE